MPAREGGQVPQSPGREGAVLSERGEGIERGAGRRGRERYGHAPPFCFLMPGETIWASRFERLCSVNGFASTGQASSSGGQPSCIDHGITRHENDAVAEVRPLAHEREVERVAHRVLEPQIQQNGVERRFRQQDVRGLRIRRARHLVAERPQRTLQGLAKRRFVVDDQHAPAS